MKRIISLLLAVCLAALTLASCGAGVATPDEVDPDTFTLMVYMVGSDLEAKHMAASNDIVEMLDSGLDLERVNLVIYTGGSPMWHVDVPGDVNAVLTVEKDSDGVPQLKPLMQEKELKNMGEPETLSSFLNYAYEKFPADHYGLICWDHGGGPLRGFGLDLNFEKDSMENPELASALSASPFNKENKLSFIGFDACLMSSVETAGVISDYADYMIASQETEPGDGWDYSFLNVMNKSFSVPVIADRILESYNSYYESKRCVTFNPDLTLSCMDLSKAGEVTAAMDGLFSSMKESLKNGDYYKRTIERSRVKTFGNGSYSSRSTSLDLVDLGSLADECSESFSSESAALKKALSDFVINNKTNLENAGGVSLYYPYEGTDVYERLYEGKDRSLPDDSEYYSYFEDYIKSWSADWEQSEDTADEDDVIESSEKTAEALTYTLTDEQKKNFKSASLNIYVHSYSSSFAEKEGEAYELLLYGKPLTPDKKGKITVEANESIPVVNEDIPIMTKYLWSRDGVTGYVSIGTYLSPRLGGVDDAQKSIGINFSVEDESGDLTVSDIGFEDDDDDDDVTRSAMGKNSIDPTRWAGMQFFTFAQKPTRDKNGKIKPYSEWESSVISAQEVRMSEEMEFSMEPIEDVFPDHSYYYQIVIEDKTGKRFLSELEPYDSHIRNEKTKEYTRTTPNGKYTYELGEYEATLKKYKGTDDELIIPDRIEGLSVTRVDREAFKGTAFQPKDHGEKVKPLTSITIENPDFVLSSADFSGIRKIYLPKGMTEIPDEAFNGLLYYLEEVVIPDSVTSIGYQAFSAYGHIMKRMELPAGIEFIDDGAFYGQCFTEGISFKGKNENYKIENDMLLTKDGKTLLAVFPTDQAEITIPEGVEEIAPYAHMGGGYNYYDDDGDSTETDRSLTAITFPKTLKNIRYCAFSDESPSNLIFPDSLEEIGNYAFAAADYGLSLLSDETLSVDSISFGSKLSWIGYGILGTGRYGKLTISEKNRFFAVKSNRLTNKHGDADLMDEVALSTTDNLDVNKDEYEAYLLATDGLDLSDYSSSADADSSKEYLGSEYSLHLFRNKLLQDLPSYDVTVDSVELKFPAPFKEFLKTGLKVDKEDKESLKQKFKYSESFGFTDDKGNKINVRIQNTDHDKLNDEVLPDDCTIYSLETWNFASDDKDVYIPSFDYCGVNERSTVSSIKAALGDPTEITIETGYNCVTIKLKYEKQGKSEYESDSFEIELKYDPSTKRETVLNIDLDFGVAASDILYPPEPEDVSVDKSLYDAYKTVTGILNADLYEPDKYSERQYNGNTYSTFITRKDKSAEETFPGAVITLYGKQLTLPCSYNDITSAGLVIASSSDPDEKFSKHQSPSANFKKGDDDSFFVTFYNDSKGDKPLKECKVIKIEAEMLFSEIDRLKADFNYRGVTAGSDIAAVAAALGQPYSVKLTENFDNKVFIKLKYGIGNDVLRTSIKDRVYDCFTVTFLYDPGSKAAPLTGFSLYKELK